MDNLNSLRPVFYRRDTYYVSLAILYFLIGIS